MVLRDCNDAQHDSRWITGHNSHNDMTDAFRHDHHVEDNTRSQNGVRGDASLPQTSLHPYVFNHNQYAPPHYTETHATRIQSPPPPYSETPPEHTGGSRYAHTALNMTRAEICESQRRTQDMFGVRTPYPHSYADQRVDQEAQTVPTYEDRMFGSTASGKTNLRATMLRFSGGIKSCLRSCRRCIEKLTDAIKHHWVEGNIMMWIIIFIMVAGLVLLLIAPCL